MKLLATIALLLVTGFINAQTNSIKRILKNPVRRPVYNIEPAITELSVSIPCEFGKSTFLFSENSIDLSTVQVTAVDLIFTDYPSDDDLIKLNSDRLKKLFEKYPALASASSINWKLIRQTNGRERDKAIELFHGFVVYYKPKQSTASMDTEVSKLKEMLTPEVPDEIIKRRRGFLTGDTTELRKNYDIESYTTVQKMPVRKALRYLGIDEREIVNYKNYDSLFVYEKPLDDSTGIHMSVKTTLDSTVLKVLDRMQWNSMLVVTDVTASMFPYTGQLLLWLKLNEDDRRIQQFVFFNDGDNREDDTKVAGRTGGIYSSGSSVFETIEELAFKAMINGNGGSIPENNVEALLHGIKACPDCGSIVMIADNSSAVSDLSLLKNVNRPVHIILCGIHNEINTDYLDIAKSTKGSIHFLNDDLLNLTVMKEGETITIHGLKYRIVNGKFIHEK